MEVVMALYKKYRPESLLEIRGNENEKVKIKYWIENPERNNAIVIMGPTGVGKTTIGRIVAKELLGLKSTKELKVSQLNYAEIDAAELGKVDYVRDIKKRLRFSLTIPQVLLFDEASYSSADAQGVMLKTLEDAPSGFYFIIITSEPKKLSPALKGRGHHFYLEPLEEGEMIELLTDIATKEQINVDPKIFQPIFEVSQGRSREALVMLEEIMSVPEKMQFQALRKRRIEGTGVTITRDTKGRPGAATLSENVTVESCLKAIDSVACTSTELLEKEFKPLKTYISPFLTEASLAMIYGPAGSGKTFLLYLLTVFLTRKNAMNAKIGPLVVEAQAAVLYIDGEMLPQQNQARLSSIIGPFGPESEEYPLILLTSDELSNKRGERCNIAAEQWRNALTMYLKNNTVIKILVLDNLASLMPGVSENSKESWDNVNMWLLSLKTLGVTVIIVHHANKNGDYRGHSSRVGSLDTVIGLKSLNGADDLCFNVYYDKCRNFDKGKSFSLRAVKHEDNPAWLKWEEYNPDEPNEAESLQEKQIMAHAMLKVKPQREIAEMFGVSQAKVSLLKNKAIKEGFLTPKGDITEAGQEFLRNVDLDPKE